MIVRSALYLLVASTALPLAFQAQSRPHNPGASFDQADTNRDGKVTRQEYLTARSERFAQIDDNQDGVISKADFPRAGQYPQAVSRLDAMIAQSDADKDGRVTKAEQAKAPAPAFDRADINRNGAVDQAELAALKAQRPR